VDGLPSAIAGGEIRGVILLGSIGYHSIGKRFQELGLYEERGGLKSFLPKFLKSQREEEVAVLKRLYQQSSRRNNPIWLLSVVTKEDLWIKDRDKVEKFYEHGPYGKLIKDIIDLKPKDVSA